MAFIRGFFARYALSPVYSRQPACIHKVNLNSCNFSENSEVRRVRVPSQIFTRASPWGAPDFSTCSWADIACEICGLVHRLISGRHTAVGDLADFQGASDDHT